MDTMQHQSMAFQQLADFITKQMRDKPCGLRGIRAPRSRSSAGMPLTTSRLTAITTTGPASTQYRLRTASEPLPAASRVLWVHLRVHFAPLPARYRAANEISQRAEVKGALLRLQPTAALRDGLLSALAAPSCREGNRLISARLMAACRVADVIFAPNRSVT